MGFNDDDVIVDNLDDDKFKDDKIAIINYVYCKHSQMKTVPQVFINKKVYKANSASRSILDLIFRSDLLI